LAALTCRFATNTCRFQQTPAAPLFLMRRIARRGGAQPEREALRHPPETARAARAKPLEDQMKFVLCLTSVLAAITGAAHAGGDPVAGARVFRKCMACHTVTEAANKIGPSLTGVIGRRIAAAPGYSYSPAMLAFGTGGKIWDAAALAAYLAAPRDVVPGTRMAFAGLRTPEDIADVITYLSNPAAGQ